MNKKCCRKCSQSGDCSHTVSSHPELACKCHSEPPTPYNQIDHSHCWTSDNPPCGQKEHTRCCLCEMPKDSWRDRFDKLFPDAEGYEVNYNKQALERFIEQEISRAREDEFGRIQGELFKHYGDVYPIPNCKEH